MAASSALSDGAQQADMVSSEHAETMFGSDQAETNMVKLVDGKLTPIGDTESDVSDDMPRIRVGSDEERALIGDDKKKYENSEAALRAGQGIVPNADTMPDDPIAVADLTGNPEAGDDVNTGYPTDSQPANTASANDSTPTDRTQANGADQTNTAGFIRADMIPMTPSTPDPNNPVPAAPETPQPPTPPSPGPEIPDLPGSPQPDRPEITEPGEPNRSHEINARSNAVGFAQFPEAGYYGFGGFSTRTSTTSVSDVGVEPTPDQVEPGEAVPGTQYVGMSAGPGDEGMDETPDTGDSSHPYRVNGDAANDYQPDERPNEAAQMQNQPREAMDESGVMAQDMLDADGDRTETKSTDGLDRTYNDPQAARDMAS